MPAAVAEDAEHMPEPASADAADGTAAEEEATEADATDAADRCILRTVWRAALRPTPSVWDMAMRVICTYIDRQKE